LDSSPLLDPIGTEPGAYLLAIDLAGELPLDIAALGPGASLAPGRYVYCGSAYGPGGMRARVARHLRQDKTPRWHVDRLTLTGRVVETGALAGGSECDLCAGLRALPGVRVPLLGFGSSDCRTCPAHLLAVPADFAVGEFLSGFRSPV
jgi:Uri superfamily endonuclease